MRRRKIKIPTRADSPDRWVISYADLLTLLLGFFIVLYSQSSLNVAKLRKVATSIAIAFHGTPSLLVKHTGGGSGVLPKHRSVVTPQKAAPTTTRLSPETLRRVEAMSASLRAADDRLRNILHPMIAAQKVRLASSPLSIRITLNSRVLFPGGSATLAPGAKTLLKQVADVIRTIPATYPVIVQGYTNAIPISTAKFPSNWELSAARAISVVHLFMRQQVPGRQLSVQGFSKFHPLVDVHNKAKARRENRRVEIVILAPSASAAGSLDTGAAALPAASGSRQP